jgi:GWxTD domain-containing protein
MGNMLKSCWKYVLSPIFVFFSFSLICAGQTESWERWLDRDVRYIITPKEKQIFLSLNSEKERKAFRRAFWLQRDPTPGTPANETRNEHYRRLQYVEKYLGRNTAKEAWETDRGRIYIILGEPIDIQRFHETSANTVSMELWQYQGDVGLGFPPVFYILFYQDDRFGDFRLYNPSFHDPQTLVQDNLRQPLQREDAYEQLLRVSAELAQASLSLIPGAGRNPRQASSSLSSEILLTRIHQLPEKKADPKWAEAFVRHKDVILTDYSVQYVESHYTYFVHQERGRNYLHYVIEPYKVSMAQYDDKIYSSFKLNMKISDEDGGLVHQEEKAIQVEMTRDDFKQVHGRLSALGDLTALIGGRFNVSILLRNTNSKEFSSAEAACVSPKKGGPSLSPILFLYDETTPSDPARTLPFQFGEHRFFPNTRRTYTQSDNLLVYFELYNPVMEMENYAIDYKVNRDDNEIFSRRIQVGGETSFAEKLSLQDVSPGYYSVQAVLFGPDEKIIGKKQGEFIVSERSAIPRPWRYNKVYPPLGHPYFGMIRAYQYLGQGDYAETIRELSPLYNAAEPQLDVSKLLAKAYMGKEDYSKVIEVLSPLGCVQDFEILEMLGKSYLLAGDYEAAVTTLEKALEAGGEVIGVINAIGLAYLKLNQPQDALVYFKRSLRLNPDQEDIREHISRIDN